MNQHAITLGQLARFNVTLKCTNGKSYTAEYSSDQEEVLLYDQLGHIAFHALPTVVLQQVPRTSNNHKPLFVILDHNLEEFQHFYIELVKELDVGEFLLTGEDPKVPYTRVQRRMDLTRVQANSVNEPKPGVIAHAVQGKYILATEYATPVFEANNDLIVGFDVASKQARNKAENLIWQQEGFLLALLLGQLDE